MNETKVLEYLEVYNKIKENKKDLKVYILSNFTIDPIKKFLEVEMYKANINIEVEIGGYDQYFQEVMNDNSHIYTTSPNLIIFALDFTKFAPEINNFNNLNLERKNNILEERINMINKIILKLREKTTALILINNFYLRSETSSGILDSKEELGVKEFLMKLNLRLIDLIKKENNIFITDAEKIVSKIGWQNTFDKKIEYMADILLSNESILELSKEYSRYIKSMKGWTKKCIVLDLDNTLWGGIIGEDGIENIKLGPTYPGNTYLDFQKSLLELYNKGFILAINSKNNYDDAIEVFRKHPNSILKEEHFSVMKINWVDKATNIKEIASELNIGLNSLVFFDDNPSERELVKTEVPEVLVVDMPEDSSLYKETLDNTFAFDLLKITEEDKKRNLMYIEQKKRKQLESSSNSMEDFLKKLEIKVTIKEGDEFTLSRATQMINKTNQFNLTTKRYDESQMQQFHSNKLNKIYTVKVIDKFGDHGITALAIINKNNEKWRIDSFLLSCRVIGKSIEKALLQRIIEDAKKAGAITLEGEFIKTKKNQPSSNFYKENNFSLIDGSNEEHSFWNLELKKEINIWPEWIKEI